ncbi:MAG TPA: VIT domain-containing protein, partial [Labilithrix sp.]|nr:VIT domain-containing protein [Labilithrix sp.]
MTLGSLLPSAASPFRMPATRIPHDEIDARGPGAELVTSDGRVLPLRSALLRAEAAGGIARVVLEQTFENPHDETLHVTYKMPLPEGGAVSGYVFEIAGRVVVGRVDTKAKARETFEAALAEGKTAALLEQEKADIFTQAIGNIPPRTRLVARITVDQRLAWLP